MLQGSRARNNALWTEIHNADEKKRKGADLNRKTSYPLGKPLDDSSNTFRLLRETMTRSSLSRVWAVGLLLCFHGSMPNAVRAVAQTDQSSEAQLLGKAHALELRGRMDLAKQVWQQVLNGNPNQPEALAGMAHASKLEGHPQQAQEYLNRLKAVSPNDPSISRIEASGTAEDETAKLRESGRLAQAGQGEQAMALQREVYGNTPPPGDPALSYYETEAGAPGGVPHAVAGLRALMDKYPQDARYQIKLGKILTYNPRTRAEGRKLLSKHPNDPEAQAALQQAFAWDHNGGNTAPNADAATNGPPSLAQDRKTQTLRMPARPGIQYTSQPNIGPGEVPPPPMMPGMPSGHGTGSGTGRGNGRAYGRRPVWVGGNPSSWPKGKQSGELRRAYAALNAHHLDEAERLFRAILDKNPKDYQASAGLGYVRMNQANFGPAITFFEDAEQNGDRDPNVAKALKDSRFYHTMQTATAALRENKLQVAEQEFLQALDMRHDEPEALQGLGGTLLKGQDNDRAALVFTTFVRVAPGDLAAWRGLLMAQTGGGHYAAALETEHRIPPKVKAALMRDPDYLRTLATVYVALGRDAEAQRLMKAALDLPFPVNGEGLKIDAELQYAALLSTAGRKEEALRLYKRVLSRDPNDVNAWIGLVQNEHQLGQDAAAYEAIRTMPAAAYKGAMQEVGFQTTLAAVCEETGHVEIAQQALEQLLASERAEGKKPFVPAEIQLAGLYTDRGENVKAYALYKELILTNADNDAAQVGLLGSLHATGHDEDALAQLRTISLEQRKELEANPIYLQTVGAIYAGLGDNRTALEFFARVQEHYRLAKMRQPTDLEVQEAWLLYNSHSDQELLALLLELGDRKDLTDKQRLTLQTLWANFAVRRANQASAVGNSRLALAILNAAAHTFPTNRDVIRALAGGYAAAGMPKEAVAIYRALTLGVNGGNGDVADYRGAVGAALAANDLHDAEVWLRFGLDQHPHDPQLMVLAAKFEQQRGDPNRAADYYRAALTALPPGNPGLELATELAQPAPQAAQPLRTQDLAALLSQQPTGAMQQPVYQPFLPSYSGGSGTMATPPAYGPSRGYGQDVAPSTGGYAPGAGYTPGMLPGATGDPDLGGYSPIVPTGHYSAPINNDGTKHAPTLGDFKPQASVAAPELHLHSDRSKAAKFGPYVSYNPDAGVPHFVGGNRELGDGVVVAAGVSMTAKPVSAMAHAFAGQRAFLHVVSYVEPQQTADQSQQTFPARPGSAGAAIPSSKAEASAAQDTATQPAAYTAQSFPVTARGRKMGTGTHQPSAAVKARAAAIHQNQVAAGSSYEGVSRPPQEVIPTPSVRIGSGATLSNAEYQTPQYAPAGQIPPPRGAQQQGAYQTGVQGGYNGQVYPAPPYGSQYGQQQPTEGQQYPAPGSQGTGGPVRRGRAVKKAKAETKTETPAAEPAVVESEQETYPPLQYPVPGRPLENYGPPDLGALNPGQAPSDYQLQQHNLPPLRGYYDPRVDPRRPMTERQNAELGLAQVEGSYSGWLGGTAIGRYRSGTAGIDRLAMLKVPIEASFVVDNAFRISLIPVGVFLNSGTLNTAGGGLGTGPVLGTYLGSAPNNPAQQFANGIGGEVQIATNTFSAAFGTSPYEFLVTNLIGRGKWTPGNSHFTIYGGRDSVEETQLSYAGLRDPGTATTTYGGNVWGGVVASGGGARFEYGDEHAGFYLQGEGAYLTGYHVLDNQKADGTAGAYFGVKSWPEAGSLTIGGTFYGMHFSHNERGETYGLGGYFSPEAYFLAAVPVTFTGHNGTNLHYSVSGSLGVQSFQEDNETYFPLDPALLAVAGCTNAQLINHSCGLPVNSNTGLNFSFNSEVSYRVNEHWYVGGFLSANNTNNYDTVTGGFFARYTFRPQYGTADYPTGLFPVEGFRPLRVP